MQFKQLTRLSYWQGQELRSRDLRDQSESLEQLRWWHNRAVHAVFGVRQGLVVSVDPAEPGVVSVACGIGYDCFGHELLLPARRTVPLPRETGPQLLVLGYTGVAAALSWVPLNSFRASIGVPLGLFRLDGGAFKRDEAFRAPMARALTRPRIAAGSTVPGNTSWEKLPNDAGLFVKVSTESAGFTATPFYVTALNWTKENELFSIPIVSVTNTSQSGFTLKLLLKDLGRELLPVVSGFGLVDTVVGNKVTLRKEILFGNGQDFQNQDILAKVLPQADLALPLKDVTGKILTLGTTSSSWTQKVDEPVALGRLPAVDTVKSASQAIVVDTPALLTGSVIVSVNGTAVVSAAEVAQRTTDETLILKTPLAGLAPQDEVLTVTEAGTVTLSGASKQRFTLTPHSDISGKTVLRKSSAMAAEKLTEVTGIEADGVTFDLKADIGLVDGQTLYVASSAAVVKNVGAAITLVGSAARFQTSDLVGVGATPLANHGIVAHIEDPQLVFQTPITAAAGDPVFNADFPIRSTVSWRFGALVGVGNSDPFQPTEVVAVLTPDGGVSDASILVPFPIPGVLQTAGQLSVSNGDTLGRARFGRTGTVKTTGPTPATVQLNSAAEAALFKVGDIVANVSAIGPFDLSIVDHVAGDVLVLRTAISGLAPANILGIVALNAVAVVTATSDSQHVTVDNADAAHAGGIVARQLLGWIDASTPVTLQSGGGSLQLQLQSALDGLMPGDAIGFAALSKLQPQIRFDAQTHIRQPQFQVHGADEHSGQTVDVPANLTRNDNQLATVAFQDVTGFAIRPEVVQITETSQPDDFLAYAQRQGLYVCWLGCQSAPPMALPCPGVVDVPCTCG